MRTSIFTIDPTKIVRLETRNGIHMAKYPHPFSPTQLGLTNYVRTLADNEDRAVSQLIGKLEAMGGVLPAEVQR